MVYEDEDSLEQLFEQFEISVDDNGTLVGVATCDVSYYMGAMLGRIVTYVQPTIIILALVVNAMSLVPLVNMAINCFAPYAYLAVLSAVHVLTSTQLLLARFFGLSLSLQHWKDTSETACQTILYAGDVIEQFQSWLLICVLIVSLRMKVSLWPAPSSS